MVIFSSDNKSSTNRRSKCFMRNLEKELQVRNRFSYVTRGIEKCNNCIHHHCKTPITKEPPYRHSASASKCLECLWSTMTRSWCFSKKHSRADSGVRARLHLKLAFSHAQQKPLLWLSSLAKTKSTCRKKEQSGTCSSLIHGQGLF